jgi:hypothetical protein
VGRGFTWEILADFVEKIVMRCADCGTTDVCLVDGVICQACDEARFIYAHKKQENESNLHTTPQASEGIARA